ncbi:MAG: asparaginase [Ilumatobacteraceae bacterium]|nr:asparaginase [Ilumatobacteraceae bacterium]
MTTGIVAAVDRNGVDESFHHGTVVVADPSGCRALVGDIDTVIYPRSSLKPLQTTAMLDAGLRLDSRGLALACASHDGSPAHLAVVREVLAGAGRSEADLATTPDLPYDRGEAERVLAAGGGRTSLQMNCSGKHAAMIATCVAAGWPVDGHLEPDHPLQVHIAATVERLTGDVAHIGVDGCGAPTHAVPIGGLALAISAIAAERGKVWSAMTAHPELVGGPERPVSVLMRAVPGLMAKDGAEGVFVAGLPDGRAVVVKISDGASRAAAVVAAAALRTLGVDVPDEVDVLLAPPVLGGGRTVGRVRALL